MMRADVFRLAWALGMLRRVSSLAKQHGKDAIVDESFHKTVSSAYESARTEFTKYEMFTALDRLAYAERWLNIENYPCTNVETDCDEIAISAESELKRQYFGHITAEKAKEIFKFGTKWGGVFQKFGSAERDAFEATCCYAYGRNDACVHHCMMVLERGFDALAHKLGLNPQAKAWGGVIEGMEEEIVKRQKALRAKKPSDLLTFLSVAAKEFTYFKDAWRNHSAHGRAEYDENDARKVLTHARDFMEHLSEKLKERKK